MALKVEELQTIISANADQFKGELIKVQQELRNLNKTTNSITKSVGSNLFGSMVQANLIGGIITGTISRLTSQFGGLTKSIIENGSAYSRLKIATETVTDNLGISRAELRGLRDDLADANTYGVAAENVIKTLALSGLVKLSTNLKTVDARTGEVKTGVTALTLAMKDLSAANAIDSNVGIERIAKFIQRGESSFADGLIEIGDINREYIAYAKQVGKTSDTLTALERAQVRLNIVMREGQKAFGAYANTYESSGKIFSSIRMIFRNLAETLGAALEPIFRVGGSAILTFLKGIQMSLFQSDGAIRNFANRVAGYMLALARIIGSLLMRIPVIGKNFEALAHLTMKPIQSQGNLADAVGTTNDKMNDLADSTKKAKKELMGLAAFDEMTVLNQDSQDGSGGGAGAGSAAGGVLGGLGGVSGGFEDTSAEINKFADEAMEKFKKLGEFIKKVLDNPIVKFLINLAKYAGLAFLAFQIALPILKVLFSPLATLFGWFMKLKGVVGFLAPIVTAFLALPTPVLVIVGILAALVAIFILLYAKSETFRKAINKLISEGFNWLKQNVGPILVQIQKKVEELVGVFKEKWPAIQEAIKPLAEAIENFLVEAFKILGETVDWLWKTILKPLVTFILNNIVPAFSKALDVITLLIGIFSKVAATIINVLTPVLKTMWQGFQTTFEGIKTIVSFAWNNIISPIFRALWSFIDGFIIPIIKNLLSIWSSVFNSIKSIAENVWNGIQAVMTPVLNWMNNTIGPIVTRVKDQMVGAFNSILGVAQGIWGGIQSAFRAGINGMIWYINSFIRNINNLINLINIVGDKLPGDWTQITFRVGEIPYLARGGVVGSPTLAAMGEGGFQEAVLPLDRNTEWAEKVAELLNGAGGDKGNGNTIILQVGEKKFYQGFVDWVNDKSLATNMTILNV